MIHRSHQSEQAGQAAGAGQGEPCAGQQRQGQSPGCGTDNPHRTLQAETQLAWKQPSRKGPGHPGGQKKFLMGFQHLQGCIIHISSSVCSTGEATLDTHCPVWEQPVQQRLLRWEGLEHMMCEEVGWPQQDLITVCALPERFTGKIAQGFSLRWSPTG